MDARLGLVLCISMLASGCGKSDSTSFTGSATFTTIVVAATGNGTTDVEARLSAGAAGRPIELEPGESFVASDGTTTQVLDRRVSALGDVSFGTRLPSAVPGGQFTVGLVRLNDRDAPNSTVTLPDPFEIAQPVAGSEFHLRTNDPMELMWTNPGSADRMAARFQGTCINNVSFLTDLAINGDPGTVTVQVRDLIAGSVPGTQPSELDCQVVVTLMRERTGTLDPALGSGGFIIARQQRSVLVRFLP